MTASAAPLRLRSSPSMAMPASTDGQQQSTAREARRQVERDAQTELALDSASRAKEEELARAQFRANNVDAQNARLQRELQAKESELGLWRWGAAGLAVAGLGMGLVWLRSRKSETKALDNVDSSGTFDSSGMNDPDSQALQAALLPNSGLPLNSGNDSTRGSGQHAMRGVAQESGLHSDAELQAGLWNADVTQGMPASATLHEFVDDMGAANDVGVDASAPGGSHDLRNWVAPRARTRVEQASIPAAATLDLDVGLSEQVSAAPELGSSVNFLPTAMAQPADSGMGEPNAALPDVRYIPQPMQDLMLLHRGLQEWDHPSRLGVAEQALLHHINQHQNTSGWAYLELLHVYRRKDQRSAFDQWADTFRSRFNRLAPTWADATTVGKDLLRYDLATVQLTQAWANNSVIWLLEQWLVGEPHMRRLLDVQAFRDVLMLYELCLMVNDNPYTPMKRSSLSSLGG